MALTSKAKEAHLIDALKQMGVKDAFSVTIYPLSMAKTRILVIMAGGASSRMKRSLSEVPLDEKHAYRPTQPQIFDSLWRTQFTLVISSFSIGQRSRG